MASGKMSFSVAIKLISDQFTKGLKSIERQVKGIGNFMKSAFALGSVTMFGKQMIQISSEFEDSMARVHAVSDAAEEDFKMMSEEARRLGATTKFTATEAANALENLTRNGLTARQATQALSGVLQLAQANAIGLAEAANITTNTMNMFGLTSKDTAHINDVLSSTAANSATNISQLYEALVNAAPSAHTLGISLEETSAALGAMAQRGYKGAEAGTQLRMALTKMVDPKIVTKMQNMGVAIDENVIKENGLLEVVKRLKDAHLDLGELVGIFSQRGAQGMAQLINSYNDFERMLLVIQDAEGTTERMFQQGLGSTKGSLLMLKSAYQEWLITLGEKTRGPINAVIKLLTNVVKNFKTLGGTIMNIASVVVPLFTAKVVAMMKTYQIEVAKGIAKTIALKVAMADWITIVATAVTWIGTALVASASKANQEIKRLNKEFDESEAAIKKMEGNTELLIAKLGDSYDKNTLNGVVREACKQFPDFRDAILEAARAAEDTGSYEKLKGVLKDIVVLQATMQANTINQKRLDAQLAKGAEIMRKSSNREKKAMGIDAVQKAMEKAGYTKETQESVYNVLLKMRIAGASDKELKDYLDTLQGGIGDGFMQFNHAMNRGLVKVVGTSREIVHSMDEAYKKEEAAQENLDGITKELKSDSENLDDETKNLEKSSNTYKKTQKDIAEERTKIDEEFNKSVKDAQNKLLRGWIDAAEYQQQYANAVKRAYDDLADIDGYDNKYLQRREDVATYEKGLTISPDNGLAEAMKKEQERVLGGKQKLEVEIVPEVPKQVIEEEARKTFGEFWATASEDIDKAADFVNVLKSMNDAFDELGDANANWADKLQAVFRIIQGTMSVVQSMIGLYETLGGVELVAAAKSIFFGKAEKEAKRGLIQAKIAEAGAGAAAAMASIPYIGPALAAAAAESMVGLLETTLPKFSKGGFIQGNSKYGDKLLARVNAGEAVLNTQQQKRFMDIANGKGGLGAGNVSFHIAGKDLVGVLRNNNTANSKIQSRL